MSCKEGCSLLADQLGTWQAFKIKKQRNLTKRVKVGEDQLGLGHEPLGLAELGNFSLESVALQKEMGIWSLLESQPCECSSMCMCASNARCHRPRLLFGETSNAGIIRGWPVCHFRLASREPKSADFCKGGPPPEPHPVQNDDIMITS